MFNDILLFPTITTTKDELGQLIENEDFSRQVYCEKKSVTQNEFFQAGQNGIKSSCVLVVHLFEYQDETKVKFRNKIYSIYRTYERPDETIELYVEVRSGD
ncbi:phage head closure protein [Bacillus sp. AFS017336]|uniref:phage head closure protein n=1 Tax=Bacillus sp. AFS017336 TaxID=2033489 RepID=UPI000BF0079F|nr:phage head closure protein [Bacillus sp. AFS017336]PEL13786.1 phage head-tail adapter protein [Bacillus sp. AFS017336]